MWAKVRAQNWLQSYDGRTYLNTFLYAPDSLEIGNNARKTVEDAIVESSQNMGVYPNPAAEHIDVAYRASDKDNMIEIQLTDVFGRQMLKQRLNGHGTERITINQLTPGIYFYTIREQNTITLSGKLIKK